MIAAFRIVKKQKKNGVSMKSKGVTRFPRGVFSVKGILLTDFCAHLCNDNSTTFEPCALLGQSFVQ